MKVPYVAGDRDMPEWWTEQDEKILRDTVAELEQFPRIRYAAPVGHRAPERSRSGGVIVWMALVLIFALMVTAGLVFAFAPSRGGGAPAHTGTAPTWMNGKP